MNKGTKSIIVLSSVVAILLGFLTATVFYFSSLQPETIEYPGSGLSGSIFDVQNTKYVPNSSFTAQYKYKNISYILDVPDRTSAVVDDGSVWKLSDAFYIFTSEIPFNEEINTAIGHQLGKALLLDCDDNRTLFDEIKDESGYRNGFGALYQVKKMYLSNGTESKECVVMLYLIELPSENEDVIIGTLCTEESNQNIRTMKDYTDALFGTFRFDEEWDEERQKAIKQAEYAEEKAEKEAENEKLSAERQAAYDEAKAEKELLASAVTSENSVEIDKDYNKLQLNAGWSNYNAVQSMELVSPDGKTYAADNIEEKTGVIVVDDAKQGTWTLRVTGVNVGDISVTLNELEQAPVEEPAVVEEGTESLTESTEEVTSITEE